MFIVTDGQKCDGCMEGFGLDKAGTCHILGRHAAAVWTLTYQGGQPAEKILANENAAYPWAEAFRVALDQLVNGQVEVHYLAVPSNSSDGEIFLMKGRNSSLEVDVIVSPSNQTDEDLLKLTADLSNVSAGQLSSAFAVAYQSAAGQPAPVGLTAQAVGQPQAVCPDGQPPHQNGQCGVAPLPTPSPGPSPSPAPGQVPVWIFVAVGAVLLCGGGAGGYAFLQRRRDQQLREQLARRRC